MEDFKMSLLNFNLAMIYIIHKMLVLLKSNLNYHKGSILEWFFKEYNRLLFIFLKFSQHIMMESLSLENENIIKDIGNIFRLKRN